jgi:hypothetical protein
MPSSLSLRKKILFSLICLFFFASILETVATTAAWFSWWDTSFWLFEDSGKTIRFDPVRGHFLSRTPSRYLRMTNGRLEYVGTARGNSQGFADRDDFGPRRSVPGRRRFAVFGDSFTEAQFLGQNWPDRVEDLAKDRGEPIELLNLATSGGGLANWWSILTRLVAAEDYEVDGVIFAVFASDLHRKFSAWDHRDGGHPLFGRAPTWDPEAYPSTFDQSRRFLEVHPSYILSPEEFERSLQGRWPPAIPRRVRPFFLTQIWRTLRYGRGSEESPKEDEEDGEDRSRARLISDIDRVLTERHLPALVVHIPDRPSLLSSDPGAWQKQEAEAFAKAIGARFLDGGQIFAGLKPAEIRALFLPYDGHWNQAGSNQFADFMLRNLDRLSTRRTSEAGRPE